MSKTIKISDSIEISEVYALKYLHNINNRDNSNNNDFRNGEQCAAKHAMDVIMELVMKIHEADKDKKELLDALDKTNDRLYHWSHPSMCSDEHTVDSKSIVLENQALAVKYSNLSK